MRQDAGKDHNQGDNDGDCFHCDLYVKLRGRLLEYRPSRYFMRFDGILDWWHTLQLWGGNKRYHLKGNIILWEWAVSIVTGLKVISLCPVRGGKKRPTGQSLRDGGSGIVCLDFGCVTSVTCELLLRLLSRWQWWCTHLPNLPWVTGQKIGTHSLKSQFGLTGHFVGQADWGSISS